MDKFNDINCYYNFVRNIIYRDIKKRLYGAIECCVTTHNANGLAEIYEVLNKYQF